MKTIKFNLILDDKPVRNIEQLRDNFSVEDILETYKNGLLKKWLKVRGYNYYLNKIEQLNEINDKEIIKSLINIFEIYVEDEELEQIMNIVDYINTKVDKYYKPINLDSYEFNVEKYHKGYENLISKIYLNNDNIGKLRAIFEEIESKYINLFKICYKDILNNLKSEYLQTIVMLLSMNKIREIIISDKEVLEKLNWEIDRIKNENKVQVYENLEPDKAKLKGSISHVDKFLILSKIKEIYKNEIIEFKGSTNGFIYDLTNYESIIIDIIPSDKSKLNYNDCDKRIKVTDLARSNIYPNKSAIGKVLDGVGIQAYNNDDKVYYIPYHLIKNKDIKNQQEEKTYRLNNRMQYINSNTEGYWKEIEDSKKRIMILNIPDDSKVKCIKTDRIMTGKDIKDKFIILNGLEYNSNSNEPLIYMEV